MAIRHTKSRQFVFNYYQDPYRYFPAKIIEIGYIKINKYPQELPEGENRTSKYYQGVLISFNIRRPKIMFKGDRKFGIYFNNWSLGGWIKKKLSFLKSSKSYEVPTGTEVDEKVMTMLGNIGQNLSQKKD